MNEIFNKKFLRQLFTPYGRLQRRPFAYCLLLYILIHIALRWLSILAMPLMPVMVMMLTLLLTVVITLAMLCLTIRRYHDSATRAGFLVAVCCSPSPLAWRRAFQRVRFRRPTWPPPSPSSTWCFRPSDCSSWCWCRWQCRHRRSRRATMRNHITIRKWLLNERPYANPPSL